MNCEEATEKFEELKKDISLNILEFKEEDYIAGRNFFNEVLSSGMKIKKINTFLIDCVNICILLRNKIQVFFSNDEDLKKVCKRFNKNIEVISIAESNEKVIKNFFRQKQKYWKKGQKSKR
ncbi:MAG: hypothetical protein Q7S33_04910 [Nanoarchaeota archaeon]|nr:hypothetical protein [Nanoarchaeota archaeon]